MGKIHIKKHSIAFLEKTLSVEKQQEFENHISSCKDCRKYIDAFASIYSSFDQKKSPELYPYFYTRVLARLEKETEAEYVLPLSVMKTLKPVAASLFVLTAITFSFFFGNYFFSEKTLNLNTQVKSTQEVSYETYLNTGDPMVDVIFTNEQ